MYLYFYIHSFFRFCKRAKELLRQNGVEFFAYELDVESGMINYFNFYG